MPKDEEKTSIADKATAMKKAGFHPIMIVVITMLSTPGFYQQFFDDTDEKALATIEAAYPILKKDVEDSKANWRRQNDINLKLLSEMKALKMLLQMRHGVSSNLGMGGLSDDPLGGIDLGGGGAGIGMGSGGAAAPLSESPPAAGDGDSDKDEEGAGEAPVDSGGEVSEEPPPPPPPPKPKSKKVKGSLDDLIQQQKQAPARKELPDLKDLLEGKKK